MAEEKNFREWNLQSIEKSSSFIIIGKPGSGKSTFMENLCYFNSNRYPIARVFSGTESGYKRFSQIFHPLFVTNNYNEDQERQYVLRQKRFALEFDEHDENPAKYSINILDDISDDPKVYKAPMLKSLFKLGSRHWNHLLMIATQYAIDFPPEIRKATSYVVLFKEPNDIERKKLYNNFGGIAGSYSNFCKIMDKLTGDYTAMIIDNRTQSNDIEDCIFWYKTRPLGDWKFGCREYREWGKKRYNVNYVEEIIF